MKQKLLFTSLMAFLMLISVRGWGQYAGTGMFTKITSVEELTDGYYVILNETDEFVMTNGRSGSATTGYFVSAAITPSGGTLTDPSSNNVWKIEANGAGKTIYNESIEKYVGWSSGNSASIEDVPANTNRWTFTYESSKFTVNNVATPARQLSYNSGAPRFAAYGNSGQQELQLYKMGTPPSTPTISLTPTSLSGFTYIVGNGPSAEQTFTVSGSNLTADISIAATSNYEISKTSGSGYASPLTFTQTDGSVAETTIYVRLKAGLAVGDYNDEEITATSTDADNKTVTCSGSVSEQPTITLYFRGPSWMDNNPHDPQIWGPYNGWAAPPAMTFDVVPGWWSVTLDVADASAEITYQSRFAQDGTTKFQKAFEDFGANPTFTTTTGEIWIDASQDGSFSWQINDFYLAQNKVTEIQPSNEPSVHATNFTATTNSSSAITVSWTDADSESYLIKASDVDYASITAPVDGAVEADGELTRNVASGVGTYQFTDLTANTPYYFKIYPYNGSGDAVNYKTDETVPQDEATTAVAPQAAKVFMSEYIEGSSNNKAVEIFNADNFALDLTKLTIRLYSNGSPTPGNTWTGTSGTLPPGQSIVIYNSSADPKIQAVGFESSAVTYFNGDDALDVVYDSQVTDVFGTIGTDPGASWPVAGVDGATADHTLIRKLTITQGNTDWASSAGTDAANSEWVVKDKDYFGNLSFVGTVLQGVSTNWTDVANWDMGLPDEFTNAIINGSVTVNDLVECKDLTILPLAAVTVGAGQGLIVYGDLLIKSDATGTGSFIGAVADYTITGTTTIQRYVSGGQIPASDPARYKYHLLSIPLSGNIEAGDVFEGTYLWHFVPNATPENSWTGITSLTEDLDYRKGFLSYVETAENTFSFTGNMNNGNFSTAAETIPVGKFKLIPNPYPSAIDWDLVTKTDIENAVYYFNSITGNYVSYLDGTVPGGQKYIPVGQAVFVKAKTANPVITFDNSVRVHDGQPFYKDANQTYKDILKIAVSANQSADAAFIRFRELADNNYNGFDDASKLRGFAGSPQLYTQSADDKALSINTLATSQETVIVPLAYELEVTGEAVFSFEYLETFEPTVTIFLEDLLLDKMIDLREQNTYSFEHEADNDPLRFKLHFMGVTNVNEIASSAKNFNIWTSDKQLYIHTNATIDGDLHIELFDLSGRLLQTVSQPMQTPNSISLPDYEGVIMVRVRNNNFVQTQKVFIR